MADPRPRDAACRFLGESARDYPNLFPRPVDTRGLDDRDRRLAEAIVRVSMVRWSTLTTLVDHVLDRHWDNVDPRVQGGLLAGTAQLFLLDKIPDHAAVADTVEWMKQNGHHRGTAGMVNAVLRRLIDLRGSRIERADGTARDQLLLSNGSGWQLAEDVFAEDHVRRIAQQAGHCEFLVRRWFVAVGKQEATKLALHGLCEAPIIMHGAATEPGLVPHDEVGYHVLADGQSPADVLARHASAVIQDPAASEAGRRTIGLQPGVILDYCAGRGTKTLQLASLHPGSRVLATEVNQSRFNDLVSVGEQHDRIEVIEPGALRELDEKVDLLVLDVPCSNTGVLARRPEARSRFSSTGLEKLVGIQRQIVADSIPCLSPGAHVLYTTCSLEPEENQSMPRWLEKWHGWKLVDESLVPPAGQPGDPPSSYHDGGYSALLQAR
ncbi:MAG: transcription antitermination factor NusB [Planctomycetota bacterium]|nr:transcription antitermination factor NusB [Planctomycetota bacterium]